MWGRCSGTFPTLNEEPCLGWDPDHGSTSHKAVGSYRREGKQGVEAQRVV